MTVGEPLNCRQATSPYFLPTWSPNVESHDGSRWCSIMLARPTAYAWCRRASTRCLLPRFFASAIWKRFSTRCKKYRYNQSIVFFVPTLLASIYLPTISSEKSHSLLMLLSTQIMYVYGNGFRRLFYHVYAYMVAVNVVV